MRSSHPTTESSSIKKSRCGSPSVVAYPVIRHWMMVAAVIAIATVGITVALAISALPVIPSWQTARLAAIFVVAVVVVTAIGGGIVTMWRTGGPLGRRGLILGVGVAVAIFAVFVIWLILLDTPGPTYIVGLRGEDFVTSVHDQRSGDEIFIYHSSEIPDGFIGTRVAIRLGWLPVERTILQIAEPFEGSRPTDAGLELMFGISSHLRYVYSDGHLVLTAH